MATATKIRKPKATEAKIVSETAVKKKAAPAKPVRTYKDQDVGSAQGKRLVIVESPSKARTINKYLGKDYTVFASVGHIKELPKKEIGIDFGHHYEPRYETIEGKEKIVSQIKKLSKEAAEILIATDPDREGEAIAWHIANEIDSAKTKNKPVHRVLFNEITQKAVKEAIAHPLNIDYKLVRSQQARQAMDKIVGYKVSPFLWDTVLRGLSAGRVQSVALRLICEREDEIKKFVTKEYWSILADFTTDKGETFSAKLVKIDGKDFEIGSEVEALSIAEQIRKNLFAVSKITKSKRKRNPGSPFTTSLLQQAASNQLGFGAKKTMMLAQRLYEGTEIGSETVGLITYMRTDSKRLSKDAQLEIKDFVLQQFGKDYLPESAAQYKVAENAQEAHEAIRPTSVDRTPKSVERFLERDQFRLYELIWNRTVASQMSPAEFEQTSVEISNSENRFLFRASGSIVTFDGFLRVYSDESQLGQEDKRSSKDNDETDEERSSLPKTLVEKDSLTTKKITPNQHFTKPPARYTEASLVKELDELGIGRPSTYASILSTLVDRTYVELRDRKFFASDLGLDVNRILVANFPDLFNVTFTASMETELDKIAAGEDDYERVLDEFYLPFEKNLAERKANPILPENDNAEICDKCGTGHMVYKRTKSGRFLGCSNYPKCKNIKPDPLAAPKAPPLESGIKCFKCETGRMLVRKGRFGTFLACNNYPTCDGLLNLDKQGRITPPKLSPIQTDIACPKCNSPLVLRNGKRGLWLACSRFPKCRGRKPFSELDESAQKIWETKMTEHEKSNPTPQILTIDGYPADLTIPLDQLREEMSLSLPQVAG
jgi:DNA topoisomerase-1